MISWVNGLRRSSKPDGALSVHSFVNERPTSSIWKSTTLPHNMQIDSLSACVGPSTTKIGEGSKSRRTYILNGVAALQLAGVALVGGVATSHDEEGKSEEEGSGSTSEHGRLTSIKGSFMPRRSTRSRWRTTVNLK